MDTAILDVVLGLVLIYLMLALLISKVQEVFAGNLRAGRAHHLQAMVLEVAGQDEELRKRMFTNPTIFALSVGEKPAAPRNGILWTATGPSHVPPDVLARVLLVELFDPQTHKHPSTRWATPQQFLADREHEAEGMTRVMGSLRTLLAGREGNWPAFEAAVAKWITDIGDRADGWHQRSMQSWSFWLALGLSLLLMADSFQLVERLSSDPSLRRSLSTLAQQVNAVFPGGKDASAPTPGTAAAPTVPQSPALRADAALRSASAQLVSLYFRNAEVTKFDPNRQPMSNDTDLVKACAKATAATETGRGKPDRLSNPSTWMTLLPPLQSHVKQLRLPPDVALPPQPAASAPASRGDKLRHAFQCITNLSGWVTLADGASADSAARTSLSLAATQLDLAADALLEMIEDQGGRISLTELFKSDPVSFNACVELPGATLAGLRQCVAASGTDTAGLPLGWTKRNRRLAFCQATPLKFDDPLPATSWLCGDAASFPGHRALALQPIGLISSSWLTGLSFLLGCLVTAFFVALGAPFWFDVLGRVVKLRAAGAKRDEPAAAVAVATPGDAPNAPKTGPELEPFSLARNEFERSLVPGDIVVAQTEMNLTQSGVIDGPTRAALLARFGMEEFSAANYLRLTGRASVTGSSSVVGGAPQTLYLNASDPRVQPLATALMKALNFPGRINSAEHTFTPELRALSVLWRYKRDAAAGVALPNREPVRLAQTSGALDELSPALIGDMLAVPASIYARDAAAPWLDVALGELGQTAAVKASTREASNRRILDYFEAAGDTTFTDSTAWCAAFVSWVLRQPSAAPGKALPDKTVASKDFADPKSWGTLVWSRTKPGLTLTVAQPGDLVTLDWGGAGGVDHVAFVLAVDPAGTHLHMLGGNQGQGCVSVSHVAMKDVFAICRLTDVSPPPGASP